MEELGGLQSTGRKESDMTEWLLFIIYLLINNIYHLFINTTLLKEYMHVYVKYTCVYKSLLVSYVAVTNYCKFSGFNSVQFSCLVMSYPMDCSAPVFPVHHQLPRLAQTHVHQVGDAIQPSHPLLSPSPPAFNLSQPQGLFKWVSSSHQVATVSDLSFSIIPSNTA